MTNSPPQLVPGNFQSCIQEDWVQDKVHSSISFMSLNLPKPWVSFVVDFIQESENSTGSLDYLSLTYLSSFSVGFVCTLAFSPCGWLFSSMNILNFTCHRTFVFTVFFSLWCNLHVTGSLLLFSSQFKCHLLRDVSPDHADYCPKWKLSDNDLQWALYFWEYLSSRHVEFWLESRGYENPWFYNVFGRRKISCWEESILGFKRSPEFFYENQYHKSMVLWSMSLKGLCKTDKIC